MSPNPQGRSSGPGEDAAYWHARLRSEDMSETEAARFKEWLSAKPAHRREFDQLSALWGKLDGVANAPEILARRQCLRQKTAPPLRPALLRGGLAGWALAASLVIALAFVFWPREIPAELYATALGEQKTVTASDGSVITLNTSTQVRLQFSRKIRSVELLAGQATFEVAKDHARPFVVSAGKGQVRALGTVFDVYKRSDDIVVTLIEGRVEVLPEPREGSAAIVMSAGEQVSFGPRTRVPVRAEADVQRASAWRSRKLDFQETPLAEAIAEANRYSRVKIELHAPPEVGEEGISGVFDTGRNDALAEAFRSYFGLEIERPDGDVIVLKQPSR
jgi:transmembrane sensor